MIHSIHKEQEEQLEEALSYRRPMTVTEVHIYRSGYAWAVCPRCSIPLDREYQSFCDRCGQAISWKGYRKAQVVCPNPAPNTKKLSRLP